MPSERRVWVSAAALCAVLVIIAFLFLDRPISSFVHAHIGRPHPILFAMQSVPEWLVPIATALLVVLGLKALLHPPLARIERALLATALSLATAQFIGNELKILFGRTWPETFVANNPSFIDNGVYGFFWLHGGAGWASFPSGHTTAISSVAAALAFAFPWLRIPCALAVLIVVIGLIGLDFHFLSDIIAGGFLGTAVAATVTGLMGARDAAVSAGSKRAAARSAH
ncbi:phosphatase PAP2 family protein [Segnochrobactrum spirostomi]|nr:phosphatase PAP2 family protein [Segnochrobactrum spirostomi]